MNNCQKLELIQVRNKIRHYANIEIRREQSVYMVGYFCLLVEDKCVQCCLYYILKFLFGKYESYIYSIKGSHLLQN